MAVIIDLTKRTWEIFARVIEARSAPSDEIHLGVSMTSITDPDGEQEPGILVFIAVSGEGDVESTTCTLVLPCQVVTHETPISLAADNIWDLIQAKRLEKTMDAMGLVEPTDTA